MAHGLRVPQDIEAWHSWQRGRHKVRSFRSRMRGGASAAEPVLAVLRTRADADICVVVDATHSSVAAAILQPVEHLPPERVVLVLGPSVALEHDRPREVVRASELRRALAPVRTVLSSGHYTMAGAATFEATPGAAHLVAQHGAVTPFAPPLPDRSTVLAWTRADGDFWRSGRRDVEIEAVGSELLWRASRDNPGEVHRSSTRSRLTFLGQGHAAELPRALMVEAAMRFCRSHDAVYRPHPSELDRLSRLTLRAYEVGGVRVQASTTPLALLDSPTVSVFSTGVLEAAARGRDAWVYFPRPPSWLREFWERYGMSRFGLDPTPSPWTPELQPARRTAELLLDFAD